VTWTVHREKKLDELTYYCIMSSIVDNIITCIYVSFMIDEYYRIDIYLFAN
jgi:hypothetical protein